MKALLDLKTEYKSITGKDWKPGTVQAVNEPVKAASDSSSASSGINKAGVLNDAIQRQGNKAGVLNDAIQAQGNKVRDLKAAKASKVSHLICQFVIIACFHLLLPFCMTEKNVACHIGCCNHA